ncbi:hypothetical protein CYMTET_51818 [Cymbomonas tetramitiformis]|uniref:Uncharacterized protein n=1 Tax=Cymbomonas tetramitiformis TaxID=36881 RepID=A0AAE0BM48_9CHLO|nr:hypothetical protein CYMTET_51818 [Cymbomonas tetramitiformis]
MPILPSGKIRKKRKKRKKRKNRKKLLDVFICLIFIFIGLIYLCLAWTEGSDVDDMVASQNTAVREWKEGNFRAFKDSFCGDDNCHFDVNGTSYYLDSFGSRVDRPVGLTLSKQTEVMSEDWRYTGPARVQQDSMEYGSESYTDALWFMGVATIQAPADPAVLHLDLTAVSGAKTSISHFDRIELQSGCREFVHAEKCGCTCALRLPECKDCQKCKTYDLYSHRIEIQRRQSVEYYAQCSSSMCDTSAALKEGGGAGYNCAGMETVYYDLYPCDEYSSHPHSSYDNHPLTAFNSTDRITSKTTCPGQRGEEWACTAETYGYLSENVDFTVLVKVRSTADPYVHKGDVSDCEYATGDVSDCEYAIDNWGFTDFFFVAVLLSSVGFFCFALFEVYKFRNPECFDGDPEFRIGDRRGSILNQRKSGGETMSPPVPQPIPMAAIGQPIIPDDQASVPGYSGAPWVPLQQNANPHMLNGPQSGGVPGQLAPLKSVPHNNRPTCEY